MNTNTMDGFTLNRISIERVEKKSTINKKTIKHDYIKDVTVFVLNYLGIGLNFLHKWLDKLLVCILYKFMGGLREFAYQIESFLYQYMEESKYIEIDKYEQKLSDEKVILLGFGLQDTKEITLQEIMNTLNVSFGYARKIKEVAKNHMDYFYKFKAIMSKHQRTTDKKDERVYIAKSEFARHAGDIDWTRD